jgi:hypothetical protein
MEASKNYKFWIMAIFGFVIIRFLWNLQDKKYVEDFLDKNYESIILKVPLKDDNNKGLYYYQCQNFDGKIEEISISLAGKPSPPVGLPTSHLATATLRVG